MATLPAGFLLSCSPVELFTLTSLLGGEMLIGVPDPFPGWLTEEIEEAMQAARKRLEERGHLALRPDGQAEMDVSTAALVGTLVAPQVVFLLTETTPEKTSRQWACYRRSPLTVLLGTESDTLSLRPIKDSSALYEHIMTSWQIGAQKAVRAEAFSVLESAVQSAQEARPAGVLAVQHALEEKGASIKNARALARTLATSRRNGALVAMRSNEGAWEVGGLGILEGENGLWLLRSIQRQQANWVELVPCSAKKLGAEIELLLKRFLPAVEG